MAAGIGDLRDLACLRAENGPFRPDRHPSATTRSQRKRRLCQKTGTIAGATDVAVNFAKFIG
jgi:hypothetical protein